MSEQNTEAAVNPTAPSAPGTPDASAPAGGTGPSQRPTDPALAALWDVAATVTDPEIPVLTLADLGVLRQVYFEKATAAADTDPHTDDLHDRAVIVITPTYSGCPAMATMAADLEQAVRAAGYADVRVQQVLRPAWTTDWMTEEGKAKLNEYGIAPPTHRTGAKPSGPIALTLGVKCPRCNSLKTKEMTRFGSTSCKALYVCNDCMEPFDYFKVH